MTITRRSLLRSLSALGAITGASALGLRGKSAHAAGAGANHFVLVFAGGGWDPTYVFDPKPDSPYVDMGVGELSAFGDGNLWLDPGRPAVTEYFERFGDITSVVNGINVPSVAHESCRVRLLTGSRDRTRPDLGVMIGHSLGSDRPMPCLDIGGNAYAGYFGADLGYVGASSQIASLIIEERAYKPPDRPSWARHFMTPDQRASVRDFVEARAERELARRANAGVNARRYDSFMLGLERGHQLHDFPDFFADMPSGKDFASQSQIAVAALRAGVSRTVNLTTEGGFDTHQNNFEQAELYESTFAGLNALMDLLAVTPSPEGGMLIEDTVVMLMSEMGRTPMLNDQQGKDHWPFTSCLVAGCGVRGNHISGATTETLIGAEVDYASGEVAASGKHDELRAPHRRRARALRHRSR